MCSYDIRMITIKTGTTILVQRRNLFRIFYPFKNGREYSYLSCMHYNECVTHTQTNLCPRSDYYISVKLPLNGNYLNCCCDVVVLWDCESACAVGYVSSETDAESALGIHANGAEVYYFA